MRVLQVLKILPTKPYYSIDKLDYIVGGIFLYTLTNSLLMFYLPQIMWWVFDLFAVLLFLKGLLMCRYFAPTKDIAFCAIFLILYSLFIIFAGVLSPSFSLPHVITNQHYVLPYLLPLLLFIKLKEEDYYKIYNYLYLGCFLTFIFLFFNAYSFIFDTENAHRQMNESIDDAVYGGIFFYLLKLSVGFNFFVPIAVYYMSGYCRNSYHKALIALVMIVTMFCTLSFGRRSISFFCIILILSPIIVRTLRGKNKIIYITLILLILSILYYSFFSIIEFFPSLAERWDTDTRSEVIGDFWNSFDNIDIILGKGLDATYNTSHLNMGDRNMIENAYLDIILRTGVVYLIPYIYMMVSAGIRGIIKANNDIVIGASVYLFVRLMMMWPGNIQMFALPDMMMYFCISLCCTRINWNYPKYLSKISNRQKNAVKNAF